MNHIETKQDFYKLSRKLILGNILRQWTWDQFWMQCHLRKNNIIHDLPSNGMVGVRHVRKSFTNKGTSQVMKIEEASELGLKSSDQENLLFDEVAPHENLTIQGEVMAGEKGLYVRYSDLQVHQRVLWQIDQCGISGLPAFQLPCNMHILTMDQRQGKSPIVRHIEGIRAVLLLKQYMDVMSFEKLSDLLSCQLDGSNEEFNFKYPIVEFACFSKPVGVLKWNTLFWEVRTDY
jgi:hypothetical protein